MMTTFSFYKNRYKFFLISGLIFLVGIIGWFIYPLQLDIQFRGGTELKYSYTGTVDTIAAEQAITGALGRSASVQSTVDFATDETRIIISLAGNSGMTPDEVTQLEAALSEAFPDVTFEGAGSSMVEASLGRRFLLNGIYALVLSSILIVVYVWFRFKNIGGLSSSVFALVALIHDVLIVTFAFVLFRIPVGDAYVAVTLTLLGYSVNDTIVIYDRIRENKKLNPKEDFAETVDKSIRQSFTRTLMTSITTVMAIVCVYAFAFGYGIDSIKEFALPMGIGMVAGCYSSICIAGPLSVMWQTRKLKS